MQKKAPETRGECPGPNMSRMMCIRDIPLREVERDWTISKPSATDIDLGNKKKFIPRIFHTLKK
jgi:hypothetical protein